MRLQVEARAKDLTSVGVLPRRSMTLVLRFNAVSTWQIGFRRSDVSQRIQDALTEGGGIIVRDLDNPTADPVLSGPWTGNDEEWTASDTGVITLSGVDDLIHVQDRILLPVPDGDFTQEGQSAAAYDLRNGPAGDVIRGYTRGLLSAFPQAGFTVGPDGGEGTNVKGSARYDDPIEVFQTLAVAGGDIGFRVVQRGTGLVFECYTPVTRTGLILSRQTGTLIGGKTTRSAPSVTSAIVLRQGEGTQRQINIYVTAESSEAEQAWGRTIITVLDRRDTDDVDTAVTSAVEAIQKGAPSGTINADLQDTELVRFGRDYGLGDRVKYQPWWLPVTADPLVDVVREVKVEQSDGTSLVAVTAAVGPPGTDTSPSNQYARIKALEAKVNRLGAV